MEANLPKPILLGLGNVFIDWYANADHALLDNYGLKYGVPGELTEAQIPVLKDLEGMPDYHEMPGGSAVNTLRAFNHLMRKEYHKDGSTLYFGSIAKDSKGEAIKNLLEQESINFRMNEHTPSDNSDGASTKSNDYTGQCAIVIVDGERTPVSNSGANNKFETSHFIDNINALDSIKILYIEGFFVSSNFEAIQKAIEYSKENNKKFALNLWGEFWIETYKDHFLEILPNCDMVFGNRNEFKSLGGILGIEYESNEDLVMKIAE